MNADRYQELVAVAKRLKQIWPVERFVTIVVGVEPHESGDELKGQCPSPDHRPYSKSGRSFKASPSKDVWKCWGCGRSGDIYTLTDSNEPVSGNNADSASVRVARIEDYVGEEAET